MISGKRSSRCSRKDLTGNCACPLRGVKDDIAEEKQQMQQEGSHWELCLSSERASVVFE